MILIGWLATIYLGTIGWLLLVAGIVCLLALIWWQGSAEKRTHYRPKSFTKADYAVILTALLSLAIIVYLRDQLSWSPFLTISLPPFDPQIGMALLLFLTPMAVSTSASQRRRPT